MNYKNLILYYISGTGNSYRVTKFIEELSTEKGINSSSVSIKEKVVDKIEAGPGNLVGFIFPTHGFTMPWSMFKFVLKLPRNKSNHAFAIATRGSFRFGKIFFPGMSGSATFVVSLILWLKGFNVRGVMSINMPSNWFTLNNLYEFIGGVLLSPISLGYLLVGRFFLAKLFFTNSNCDACEVCVKNCSFNALEMRGKKKPLPFWKYNCESCMRCAAFCPKNAIESGQSWGVILYFITTFPLIAYGINWLNDYLPWAQNLRGSVVYDILDFLYYYPAIFLSYIVFYYLMRVDPIRWLFSHTTFTHLKKWRRYKEPKIKLKNLHNQKKTVEEINA